MNASMGWIGKRVGKRNVVKHHRRRTVVLSHGEPLESRNLLTGQPIITEFMATNSDTLIDGNGASSDWIEIYNSGTSSINLEGWYLTDDAADLTKWQFPSVDLDTGEFLIVFASGNDLPDGAGNLHTNFQLTAGGEYLGLIEPDGTAVASEFLTGGLEYPNQVSDISYGILQNSGLHQYFDQPTPGAVNVGGFSGFVGDTQFSRDRGHYDAPFALEITTETPGAEIYYTTDGSVPNEIAGTLYTSPLTISSTTMLRATATRDGFRPSNVDTQTYIFLEDVLTQRPQSDPGAPSYPNTWQASVAGDYDVDPEVVADWDDDNPANDDFGIREALKSIPSMSIVMNHNDLWGPAGTGIYTDAERRIRKSGSVEYFDPNTGEQFQYNVGVQMHGNASRDNVRLLKHSFRIIFSPQYDGPGRLNFPIFDGSDFADINTLVLRASFTDAFATRTATNRYSPMDSTYTRDVWMRESQLAMGSLSADSTFVHLYINGLYWGMYNPSEKADAAFYAAHEGGQPEDWDVLKDFDELDSGNRSAWNQLFALANQLPNAADPDALYWQLRGMDPDGTDNPDLANYLDMENLIDYMILHLSTGPEDWPSHNWHAGRNRVNPGKGFQFQTWDQEIVLDGRFRDKTEASDKGPAQLHARLRNSPEYLRHFGDRVQLHMFNGGALTVEANQERWMAISDHVEAAIIGESARWGDAREGQQVNVPPQVTVPTLTVDHWRDTVADVRDRQFDQYHELALEWFREDGLFPGVNTPEFNQHGGPIPAGFGVTMTSTASVVTEELVLLQQGDEVQVFVPPDDTLETGDGPFWFETDFVPSGWTTGTSGVGFEDNPTAAFQNVIGTDIGLDWDTHESSVYSRFEFNLDDNFEPASVEELKLRMKYDDGFVVYLNGQMVASDRAPTPSSWNSKATGTRISILSTLFFTFDLTTDSSLLRPGKNVLAIQALNRTATDGDLLVLPRLELTRNVALDSPPIYFTTNGEDPRLLDGNINNGAAQLFTEPLVIDETTRIQARAMINGIWSALTSATFVVTPAGGGVVLSEVNYNPYAPTVDEQTALPGVGNENFEFIEFLNTNSSETVNLLDMHFTDGIDFRFGNVTLNPGERGVIVRDAAAFVERYGNGPNILGSYEGGLSNGGERVEFVDAAENVIAGFEYSDGGLWSARADGVGATLELVDPHATPATLSGKYYAWRGSTEFGGTPGGEGAGPIGVIINEVLAHSDSLDTVDSIELLNTTLAPIDMSGWWLSDASGTLNKFVVPTGTVLAPGEFVVFDEAHFNPTPETPALDDFALSSGGDDVWLVIPGASGVHSFVDEAHFGASPDGVTFGRSDAGGFVPQSYATLGCDNLHPRLGSVVVSEVNYNPGEPSLGAKTIYQAISEDDLEFVELFNPSASSINLSDWRLRGGVDLTIGSESLEPGESLLAISFDPNATDNVNRVAAFRAHYGLVGDTVRIVGGWNGQLSDSGEDVRLRRPEPTPEGTLYVYEDGVAYDDRSPWSTLADGSGASLQRGAAVYPGNLATSWFAVSPTPGVVSLEGNGTVGDFTGDGNVDARDIDVLADATTRGIVSFLDLDGSGTVDDADRDYLVTTVIGTIAGDANLDFVVDGSDFNLWNDNKFENCGKSWSDGDFNGDHLVDASDFNIWSSHRFTAVAAAPAAARAPRQAKGESIAVANVDAVHSEQGHAAGDFLPSKFEQKSATTETMRRRYKFVRARQYRVAEVGEPTTIDYSDLADAFLSSWSL